VLVHGQTGRVHGRAPWSVPKLLAAALLAATVVGALVVATQLG
jgi:hypothetical protein